ncbi:MAG: hypothetical protein ABL973_20860 [Micropepsaceae bacterium]
MTVISMTSRTAFIGDGVSRIFPIPFRVWSASDLKVYFRSATSQIDEPQPLGTVWWMDLTAYPGIGNLVFSAAPPLGTAITVLRDMALTQELDLATSGAFAAENIEMQLDKLTAEIQTLRELIARSPRLPVGSTLADLTLPEPAPVRANHLIGINAAGTGYESKVATGLNLQAVSAFAANLLDDQDAAAARATLGVGTAIDLNLLASDTTGGTASDLIPFVDASEANASKKVSVPNLLSNAIAGLAVAPTTDPASYELLIRKLADGAVHRLPLSAAATGRQTVWIPATAMLPRLTAGPGTATLELPASKLVLRTLDFDPAVAEFAQVTLQMPKGWNLGTLSAIFVWSHAVASANFNVVWALRALTISDDDPLDVAFGTAVQVTDSGGTTNDLYRSPETPALTPPGPAAQGDVLVLELFRAATDANDTLPADARLHGIALFFATSANTDN